jgi:hypothetical protein
MDQEARPTRVLSANDLHVLTTQFLSTAEKIHIAMCRLDDDRVAQSFLNAAMHSALIGAETCRQIHASPKRRIRTASEDPDDDL